MAHVGQQLFAGGLSGFATTVILQPFDLLKTRLQQGDGSLSPRHAFSIMQTTKNIFLTDGMKGLWRGTAASLVRNVPGVALYLTSVTQLRALMATSPYFAYVQKPTQNGSASRRSSVLPALTSQGNLIAGATTRVAVGFILNPFSVLKARYESNMYTYTSLGGAFGSIIRQGPSEILRGFVASSLRDAPYAGLFMVLYEAIKRETSSISQPTDNRSSALLHGFSAAAAGAIATTVTHPFDVIKTKMQVRRENRYHGFNTTIMTLWRQRGFTGYFDGMSLRMSRKVLSSAIGWAVYESVLIFMRTT
ncbi:hypothetical protein AX17_006023 [Amanita inopinata Kibby_2008]|nr:hypothetical protein AX17_006023 [Amanita inopinata Kibby_2008]